MGHAQAAVAGGGLVARADEMLAGLDLELVGPARIRPQLGDVQRIAGEPGDRAVQPGDLGPAHQVEPDALGRNRAGMAVLHPHDDFLAIPRRRKTGIEIRRPGIGVMGAGQHRWIVTIGVQRIFHDVMAGAIDHMHKKLAGEIAQPVLRAHFGAVDHHGRVGAAERLLPGRQPRTVAVEQGRPDAGILGAVAAPVIGRDQPCVVAAAVAEEGEIGGEVDRRQIVPLVGQQRVGYPQLVEGQDIRPIGHQMPDLIDQPAGIERRDQHHRRPAAGQLADRPGGLAGQRLADARDVLHEGTGDGDAGQVVKGGEGSELVERVVHRHRSGAGKPADEGVTLGRRLGMAERLEKRHAAAGVGECLDIQGHDLAGGRRTEGRGSPMFIAAGCAQAKGLAENRVRRRG